MFWRDEVPTFVEEVKTGCDGDGWFDDDDEYPTFVETDCELFRCDGDEWRDDDDEDDEPTPGQRFNTAIVSSIMPLTPFKIFLTFATETFFDILLRVNWTMKTLEMRIEI